jgi:branched-chain amino acid transport system ATP-binding protein
VGDALRPRPGVRFFLHLVEQNARIALELADRAYVLQHGHVVIEGMAADLAADPAVQRAYLGAA